MKHLIITALFLTTACGSSTTVVNREPIGNAGSTGIEETGGSAGSIGQAGYVSETGGNVGTGSVPGIGGTGNNPSTGGSTTGGNNGTGGIAVNPADYILNPTCGLIQNDASCNAIYPGRSINLLCTDPTNYPAETHIYIYPSNPANPSLSCTKVPNLDIIQFCCSAISN